MKKTLIYALHSGNFYGTEQMALATCDGLRDEFDCHIFAPPGLALVEAGKLNFKTTEFSGPADFAGKLLPLLENNEEIFFVATGVVHSLALLAVNLKFRRRVTHLHLVHGGTDEKLSYGRKKFLNLFNVQFVAVSSFVKDRLAANGVRQNKVEVIENFLPAERAKNCAKRAAFTTAGINNIAVISRVDPIKRIDLLLDALDQSPALSKMNFTIYGTGSEFENLKIRAARRNPNVTFAGFRSDIGDELAKADLLLHLCPQEPFGLAIIEAFAAKVPVLVPDSGGAGSLVKNGHDGFHFCADDAQDLILKLSQLRFLPPEMLNAVTENAVHTLNTRFGAAACLANYRRLLAPNGAKNCQSIENGAAII